MGKRKSKTPLNRREFLGSSARNAAHAAAGVVGLSQVSQLQAASSSNSAPLVRLGVVGLRNQGTVLLDSFLKTERCKITALCDIDPTVQTRALKSIERSEHAPVLFNDFRKLLDSSEIDAVVIATPDHHHAWMTAMACDAGKDVYLEVPTTHTLSQSDQLETIIKQTNSIVQVGLQHRSGAHFQSAIDFLHSGQLGNIYQAKAWSSLKRQKLRSFATPKRSPQKGTQPLHASSHSFPSEQAQLAWLGGNEKPELHPLDWHFHWRWMWNFGSGELGNWGIHLLDTARWGLGVGLPERVIASGTCHHFSDGRQTPDTMNVIFEYPEKSITWEHRQWTTRGIEGRSHGVAFYAEKGILILDRSGWKVYDHLAKASAPASELRLSHAHAFLDAVLTRESPKANFETGNISTKLCHLGNLAYREKRVITSDA